jgi:hypothetical protein
MDKAPKYKFLDELVADNDTCPIEILEGQFAGIVFKYGKISLHEVENENLAVNMDISIIKAPEGFDQETEEFTNTVGEIFVNIVESNTEDSVDLEDDVHQDKPGQSK